MWRAWRSRAAAPWSEPGRWSLSWPILRGPRISAVSCRLSRRGGRTVIAREPRLFVAENDGQAALVAQQHDLAVRALRQLVRDLDRLPLQQLGADALGDDVLEIGDALALDALALRLLSLSIQDESH